MPNSEISHLQQTASNPNNSAWVFASAGSGKTKILTDRVLRLLLDDVAPNKILCLTFTNNAAIEMQNRINDELAKWILCSDLELEKKLTALCGKYNQAFLQKARTLLIKVLDDESKIKVQTIHAFCQSIIRLFPLEAKIRPDFEVIESLREKLLLKQAQQELIQLALTKKGESLAKLISDINATLHESSLAELASQILSKKEKLRQLKESLSGIENVIGEIFTTLGVNQSDDAEKVFGEFLENFDQQKISDLTSSLENSKSKTNQEKIAALIRKFLNQKSLENFYFYRSAFFTDAGEPRKISDKEGKDENLLAIAATERQRISQFSDKLNSLQIANDTALLLRFCDLVIEAYSKLKQQNGFLDYNDLITETNRLLANPDHSDWIKLKMDGAFDHILVDESQDTNHHQWAIIKALSEDFFSGLSSNNKKRSIFIVGDEKQSIYSFQGAEPHISEEIFAYFQNKLGNNLKKIELNNSFRSTKSVLQAVDLVFSNPERKKLISKVSEFKHHQPIRDAVGKVEIWPQIQIEEKEKTQTKNPQNPDEYSWEIDFSSNKKNDEEENETVLAAAIAQKIRQTIAEKEILPSSGKSANYGDFMILLRNRTNGFSAVLEKTFHQQNIPFASVSRIKFSESLLVQDLLAAAKFALFSSDDLNLACLLKSPLIRISEEDLLELCLIKNRENVSLHQAIGLSPNFSEVRNFLAALIAESKKLSCCEFFYFLLSEENRRKTIAAFGRESLELLDKFILTTFDFSQNFSPHLQKFLEFVEDFDPEISLAASQENCVKISTVHGAKGLQAPVVFLPDCCYNFNQLLSTKEVISWLPAQQGILPIWCRKKELQNQLLSEHQHGRLADVKEENLRLLYVAMTRAQDEFYVGGFGKSNDEKSWYEIVRSSLLNANSNSIRVISAEEFFTQYATKPELKPVFKDSKTSNISSFSFKLSANFPSKTSEHSEDEDPLSHDYKASIKGKIIHKVLEIFGKNHREEKKYLADLSHKIINREQNFSEKEKRELSDLTSKFLHSEQFGKLFNGEVKCEVEVVGKIGNIKAIKRLDLVIEQENEILIVDYKSDEALPEAIPPQYIKQLKNYCELMQKIHPLKKISAAILWVKFLKLERL